MGSQEGERPALTSISKLFPQVTTLQNFLSLVIGSNWMQGSQAASDDVDHLLNLVHIIPDRPYEKGSWLNILHCSQQSNSIDMDEILNRAVAQLVRSSSSSSAPNILSYGYRQKAANSNSTLRNHLDLECYFVNTVQSMFLTTAWRKLVASIGTKAFSLTLFIVVVLLGLLQVNQSFESCWKCLSCKRCKTEAFCRYGTPSLPSFLSLALFSLTKSCYCFID